MELANIANCKIKNCFGIEKFQGRKKIGCARHSSEVVLISSAQALRTGVVAAAVSANLMRSMYALRNPVRTLSSRLRCWFCCRILWMTRSLKIAAASLDRWRRMPLTGLGRKNGRTRDGRPRSCRFRYEDVIPSCCPTSSRADRRVRGGTNRRNRPPKIFSCVPR
jgi:hypothetical protein